MNKSLILALDFGGTHLSAGLTQIGQTSWLAQQTVVSPPQANAKQQYTVMLGMIKYLLETVNGNPNAIGISFGGPVYSHLGHVRLSYHIPGWEDAPLTDWFKEEFNIPVAVDNDANAAALGELYFGAAQGCHNLLYVTVSTGIGGGWVIDGQPYSGADGLAGEIGHIPIQPNGYLCRCGRHGCLEAEASGPAIAYRAQQYLTQAQYNGDKLLTLTQNNPDKIVGRLVSQAAADGDELSQAVLRDAATQLGRGLSTAISLMNPARVILGGGVTNAGALWWQTVRETTRHYTLTDIPVGIMPAGLGDTAPLWGAVVLAKRAL